MFLSNPLSHTITVFPTIRPAGLNYFYFGIEGSVSEPGLISG